VRDVRRDRPRRARDGVARLVADAEAHRPRQQQPNLFVLVRVLRDDGARVELDDAQRQPVAPDCARDDARPDR
jgi:hypothetical protein